jgi:hypothetical protein
METEETETETTETETETESTPQTLEEAQAENDRLKSQLSKVNSESAKRRIRIKELESEQKEREEAEMDDLEKSQTRTKDLEKQNQAMAARLREHDLRRAFKQIAEKMEVQFSSTQALDDAFTIAQPLLTGMEIEEDGSVDSKEMKLVVKEVLDGRDYLVSKSSKPPNIDAGKRGAETLEASQEELEKKKRANVDYSSF